MKKWLPYFLCLAILVLALGVQYKIRIWQAKAVEPNPISVPYVLGNWSGFDLKMDRAVLEILNPDTIVFRRYRNETGGSADLFCVFYQRQKSGQILHSPANCYPGTGWDFLETRAIALKGLKNPDARVSASRTIIRKGLDRRILYYWYCAGERTAAGPYWNKFLMLYNAVLLRRSDGGLVTVSSAADHAMSETMERDFLPMLIDELGK